MLKVQIETTRVDLCLQLEAHSTDRYTCHHLTGNMRRQVFGGQLLANALSAAMRTVVDKPPAVLQAFFLRPANLTAPLELGVERIRDGGNFSHRRVELRQSRHCILTADVSFHCPYAGARHERPPSSLVPPENLDDLYELADRFADLLPSVVVERMRRERGVLVKPVESESGVIRQAQEARFAVWLKMAAKMSPDPVLRYAALTFMSDYWIAGVCDISHSPGIYDFQQPLVSLNHGVWYHGVPPVDDWVLYDLESPIARNGLGLGRGLIYDRNGSILASTSQHVLMKGTADANS